MFIEFARELVIYSIAKSTINKRDGASVRKSRDDYRKNDTYTDRGQRTAKEKEIHNIQKWFIGADGTRSRLHVT